MKKINNKGFSLVELMVALAILAIGSGVLFGFVNAASKFYNRTKDDVNLQTEAQMTMSWISDKITSVEKGLSHTIEASGNQKLIIFNDDCEYTVEYDKASKSIKCIEKKPSGITSGVLTTCVDSFDVNIFVNGTSVVSTASVSPGDAPSGGTVSSNDLVCPTVYIDLQLAKGRKNVSLNRNITVRNDIKVVETGGTLGSVSGGDAFATVEKININPKDIQVEAGKPVLFTASVVAKTGMPSDEVEWDIDDSIKSSLKANTKIYNEAVQITIDGNVYNCPAGTLFIDENETVTPITIKATSKAKGEDGNPVVGTATVNIVKVTGATITDSTSELFVGQYGRDNYVFQGMISGTAGVRADDLVWVLLPTDSTKDKNLSSALTLDENGKLTASDELYTYYSISDRASVMTKVGLISGITYRADKSLGLTDEQIFNKHMPGGTSDGLVDIANVKLTFDTVLSDVECEAKRNDTLDLNQIIGTRNIASSKYTLEWTFAKDSKNVVQDAGLGNSVALDKNLGTLKVSKDVDYTREYILKVNVEMYSSIDKQKTLIDKATITVKVPRVSLAFTADSLNVTKGTSGTLQFTVKGLKAATDDIIVTSTPAVRNTLLYISGSELVVSIGNTIKTNTFVANIYLAGHNDVRDSATILVDGQVYSDDSYDAENANVEGAYMYVPVPGKDAAAPKETDIKNTSISASTVVSGTTVYYYYDTVAKRYYIRFGTKGSYYVYNAVNNSAICWWKSNFDPDFGIAAYAPLPGDSTFPASSSFASKAGDSKYMYATIDSESGAIQYRRISATKYTGVAGYDNIFVYEVYEPTTRVWAVYNDVKKYWQKRITGNVALKGAASASSCENDNYSSYSPNFTLDDNTGTRWSSKFEDPQWIEIDLGSVQIIKRVEIEWENSRAKKYKLQYSIDGKKWEEYGVKDNGVSKDHGKDYFAKSLYARYLRLDSESRVNGYGNSIYEFRIYNNDFASGTNIASLVAKATASSNENNNYTPDKAIDGDNGSRWSSQFVDKSWYQLDLGSNFDIGKIEIVWQTSCSKTYVLKGSLNGTDWFDIGSKTNMKYQNNGRTDKFENLSQIVRYLKIDSTARVDQYGISIYEFKVFTK